MNNPEELPAPLLPPKPTGENINFSPETGVFKPKDGENLLMNPELDNKSVSQPSATSVSQPQTTSHIMPVQDNFSAGSSVSANPTFAEDTELIEKEWVTKAKQIVNQTKNDPKVQAQEINHLKADYLKKRYNKDVKLEKGQ